MKSLVRRILLILFIAALAGAIILGLRPAAVEADSAVGAAVAWQHRRRTGAPWPASRNHRASNVRWCRFSRSACHRHCASCRQRWPPSTLRRLALSELRRCAQRPTLPWAQREQQTQTASPPCSVSSLNLLSRKAAMAARTSKSEARKPGKHPVRRALTADQFIVPELLRTTAFWAHRARTEAAMLRQSDKRRRIELPLSRVDVDAVDPSTARNRGLRDPLSPPPA